MSTRYAALNSLPEVMRWASHLVPRVQGPESPMPASIRVSYDRLSPDKQYLLGRAHETAL